jgi:hypothetical protein
MKVFRNLIGTVSQEDVRGFIPRMAVADEPSPGLLRQAQFDTSGVMLISGAAKAFIPLRELFNILDRTDGTILLLSKVAPPPPSPAGTPPLKPRHPRR